MALVNIKELCKKYSVKANYMIENIELECHAGEIVGILGHNGAGKSTTIKCLTGMHPYDKGLIEICGFDMKKNPIDAKRNFGYVSDEFTLFEKMTGIEFINFMADIYNVSSNDRKTRIDLFQKLFALGDAIYNPIYSYSHGMKQKISIMGALIHQPKVFILDEPMVGLDPYTANQVKNFFREYSKAGNLVLFSSHNLDVVESVCDRAYIIDQGKILEEIVIEEFKQSKRNLEEYFLSITKRVSRV
jgi:ABC-2 type transport system ATP-binding protein